jgi:hypothetical protein
MLIWREFNFTNKVLRPYNKDCEDSFQFQWITLFVKRLAAENKDSEIVSIQADTQNWFFQVFVIKFVARICNHAVRILSFDAAHVQHTRYNDVLLLLVASDSNGETFVIAFSVVQKESSEHRYCFFCHCTDAEISLSKLTCFIDRAESTLKCFDLMETQHNITARYVYCTEHIICNILHKFELKKGWKSLWSKIWSIQASPTLSQ